MKYLLVVGDGMADLPIESLGGKTPMAYLNPVGFQKVGGGQLGRLLSCPTQLPPGSDVAFLTLLGNDTVKVYTGRSPLEAAGMGVQLEKGQVCFRMNLAAIEDEGFPHGKMLSHNGGGIDGPEALELTEYLISHEPFLSLAKEAGLMVYPTPTFRHAAVLPTEKTNFELTPPHDIVGQPTGQYMPAGDHQDLMDKLYRASFETLKDHPINLARKAQGKLPANCAWFWGAGTVCSLENFKEKYGKKGIVISAVPLVKGIARLGGLDAPDYEWATGLLDTGYEQKAQTAIQALKDGYDFALVHLEAPDEMSHDGSLENKLEAMRRLDERILQPILSEMEKIDDFRLLLMPDHYTLLSTRTHDGTPVPFALYDSRNPGQPRPYTEESCKDAPLLESGDALMKTLFEL